MFLHFYAFEQLLRGNQSEFFMVRSAACSVLRGASLSTFEIFDVVRGQKMALGCSFDY